MTKTEMDQLTLDAFLRWVEDDLLNNGGMLSEEALNGFRRRLGVKDDDGDVLQQPVKIA